MGLDLYYYVEGVDESGVLDNISPLEGPTDRNAFSHVPFVSSKYRYLYGTSIPKEGSVPRSSSLYRALRSDGYATSVELEGVSCLEKISQLTRDMLVHFDELSTAIILYLSDMEKIYKTLDEDNKRYLKGTLESLRKYEKEGYKDVKIVFFLK